MSDELRNAFLEDLAAIRDRAGPFVRETLAGGRVASSEAVPAFEHLRLTLTTEDDVSAFATAVEDAVHLALHSVLVTLDGGTTSAEVGTVRLCDDRGEPLGHGLHELFVDHLFATGRLE